MDLQYRIGPGRAETDFLATSENLSAAGMIYTIAANLVQTPFSWELQACFLSEKGPRRSKFGGGGSKNTTA